jgi:hypothetical protein
LLALGVSSRLRSIGRAFAAALVVAVLLAGCAAANSAPSGGAADPSGSGASTPAAAKCGPDEAMGRIGRPCQDGTPKVVEHRPRYKSDQGESMEQYLGYTYHGESYEYCKSRLDESFQAYKACIRY